MVKDDLPPREEVTDLPLIIAHRGASALAPESTLAAIAAAVDSGAEGVEFDVRLASDGVPVVFHDADLKRIAGRPELVSDLTSAELANVDVGSWFARRTGKSGFEGEAIPTLEAVLKMLDGYEGRIYVELKTEGDDHQELAAAISREVRNAGREDSAIIKSFRLGLLPKLDTLLPHTRKAALFGPNILTYLRRKRYIVALAREFGADELSLHTSLAGKNLCRVAREAGMPVTIWTADNERWIQRSRDREIRGLITNDPAAMLAARNAASRTL